jgi:hypothetical protein
MREKEKEAQPAGFFTRMRVALVGFGLAAASAAAIFVQSLLGPAGAPVMAHSGADAGAGKGYVAAPHRPQPETPDAGPDAGLGEAGERGGEIK